jgi:hypothetical protein
VLATSHSRLKTEFIRISSQLCQDLLDVKENKKSIVKEEFFNSAIMN